MNEHALKRSLTLPLLTLYGLGTILGAGIYVLVGKVAGVAGLYAPIAFLLASVLAAFTAYSFAKLSSQFPKAAGATYYIHQAFAQRWLSTVAGWMVIATGIVSAATIARGFTGYLAVYLTMQDWLAISLLLFVLTIIACWGIAESVSVAAFITLLEFSGLLLIIILLGGELEQLPDRLPSLLPPTDFNIWLSIFLGGFLAFYAFIGFEDMVNVAEEVVAPERNMPLAIILAMITASVLYILIALIAVLALPLETLQQTKAPMVDLLRPYGPNAANAIALISLIAVVNGALVQMIMGARVIYGMAKLDLAPAWFAKIAARTHTPIRATLLISALIWLLALAFPLVILAKITSFIIVFVFALVNAAQVVLQLQQTGWRSAILPWLIPTIGSLLCILFLVIQAFSTLTAS